MEYKVIETVEQLEAIEHDYNSLISKISEFEIFYSYNWLHNYILFYPDNKDYKLKIVAGYRNGVLEILCPFCLRKDSLTFITEEATDYNMILLNKNLNCYEVLKDCFSFIAKTISYKKIVLNHFRQSDVLLNLYCLLNKKDSLINTSNKYGGGYKSFLEFQVPAPYCFIQDDKQKFVKKQINDIKRLEKKLTAEHNVIFETSNKIDEELLHFITTIQEENFGNTIFSNKRSWKFFLEGNKNLQNNYVVNKCYVDDELAALHFGFQTDDRICYYIPVHLKKYRNYGIGKILLLHIIQEAEEHGKLIFDSLRGQESYKFIFCDRQSANYRLIAYPLTKNKFTVFLLKAFRVIRNKIYNP